MKQQGYDRGSMLDLAILSGGCVECIMSLCEKNNVCMTDDVEIRRDYATGLLENKDIHCKGMIDLEGIKPATALSATEVEACPYGGIGYMEIEADFEVS